MKYVQSRYENFEMFGTVRELRQGCILNPLLFFLVLDVIIKKARREIKHFEVIKVSEECYVDDMVILAKDS